MDCYSLVLDTYGELNEDLVKVCLMSQEEMDPQEYRRFIQERFGVSLETATGDEYYAFLLVKRNPSPQDNRVINKLIQDATSSGVETLAHKITEILSRDNTPKVSREDSLDNIILREQNRSLARGENFLANYLLREEAAIVRAYALVPLYLEIIKEYGELPGFGKIILSIPEIEGKILDLMRGVAFPGNNPVLFLEAIPYHLADNIRRSIREITPVYQELD